MNQMQYSVYYYSQQPQPPLPRPTKEPERFLRSDVFFAWFSLFAGYLFCRAFPISAHPLGGLIFLILLYVSTYVFLLFKRVSLGVAPLLMTLSAGILAPGLLLVDNAMLHALIYVFALAAWCHLIFCAGGNALESGVSSLLPLEFFKAIAVLPFVYLGKLFLALFTSRKKGGSRSFLKILLGIAIAILPSALIIALLSYDSSFVSLLRDLLNLSWSEFLSHLTSVMFAIPIGMYGFSLYYASFRKKYSDVITAEQAHSAAVSLRIAPALTAVAATVPILLIYVLFFISQGSFYLSAFSGVLPKSFSYAEYAREGFFQLCIVSVINFLIIIAVQVFVRRNGERPSVVSRVLSILFSGATLVLIATAFAKLGLYVQRFGLTPKRIYAGWFMALLAILFLLVIIKQLVNRLKLIPVATFVGIACFAMLVLSGIDSRIAEYNVDRYLNGSLETVDIAAMRDLDDAAIPSVVRLVHALDEKNGTDIRYYTEEDTEDELYNQAADLLVDASGCMEHSFFAFNLPRYRAEQALREAGIGRVRPFCYAEHQKRYREGDAGVSTSGFENTDRALCNSRVRAIKRATNECKQAYENVAVYWDKSEKVWLVTFYQGDYSGGDCFSVYFTRSGKTLMTVTGE